jgi:hypothetical protein
MLLVLKEEPKAVARLIDRVPELAEQVDRALDRAVPMEVFYWLSVPLAQPLEIHCMP